MFPRGVRWDRLGRSPSQVKLRLVHSVPSDENQGNTS
jgi:hypothetical protein